VKAYKLLMSAMQDSGYGAIAKLTMHQREPHCDFAARL